MVDEETGVFVVVFECLDGGAVPASHLSDVRGKSQHRLSGDATVFEKEPIWRHAEDERLCAEVPESAHEEIQVTPLLSSMNHPPEDVLVIDDGFPRLYVSGGFGAGYRQ